MTHDPAAAEIQRLAESLSPVEKFRIETIARDQGVGVAMLAISEIQWRRRANEAEIEALLQKVMAGQWKRRAERWKAIAHIYRRISQSWAGNDWVVKHLSVWMKFVTGRKPLTTSGMTYEEWTGKEPLKL